MRALALALVSSVALAQTVPAPSPLEADGWRVNVSGPKGVKLGARGKVEVSVESRAGYHLNDDYPLRFVATPTSGVAFETLRVDKAAATLAPCKSGEHACRAQVPVAFTAQAEGTAHVGGTLAFSACDDAHCLIEKVPITLDVVVTR